MKTLAARRTPLTILCLLVTLLTASLAEAVRPRDRRNGDQNTTSFTYLAGRLDSEQLAELEELVPNVTFLVDLSAADALARAAELDGADAHVLDEDLLAAATKLRWVQSWSAGVDRYLQLDGLRENERIVLTNMQGVHGPAIAEHVFATLLSLTRRLPALQEAQRAERWDRSAAANATALAGRTMLVVGMGGIGSEIARRAHAFDMTVLATVRDPDARKKPRFVKELGGPDDLERLLATAEVVAVALPLTDETRGLFGAEQFALMPAGSWFVNIGRGPIVQTDALVATLESGHLAGAALDVTDPEPLPEGHPLWALPNVIITPHVASRAELTGARRWEIVRENMQRFAAEEPLLNIVDKKLGY
jgi:phosphoglycerate dehydrogenase-like enzyme